MPVVSGWLFGARQQPVQEIAVTLKGGVFFLAPGSAGFLFDFDNL
jgi:hypothetical protein